VAADWWRGKGDAVHAVGPGGALSLSWGGRGAPRRGRRRGDLGLHAAVDGGRTSTDGMAGGAVVVANRFSVANLPLAVPCFRGHPLPTI